MTRQERLKRNRRIRYAGRLIIKFQNHAPVWAHALYRKAYMNGWKW